MCYGLSHTSYLGAEMRRINKIIVHCSDSDFGSADIIDQWHRERGFDCIGYHFVITNGRLSNSDEYNPKNDGLIQAGRPVNIQGAHCKGHNADSIGICLIGKNHFTAEQLLSALPSLLAKLIVEKDLTVHKIFGHKDFNGHKTCPNIPTDLIRTAVASRFIRLEI